MKPITYAPRIGLLIVCTTCGEPSRRNVFLNAQGSELSVLCEDCVGHARLALRIGKLVTRHVSTDKRRPGGHLRRVK